MGVSVEIDAASALVVPGQQATRGIWLRNTGAIVDRFELDIVGDASTWANVDPPTINLLPGEERRGQIVFTPPRTSRIPQGPVPFALRVMSREDTAGSAVREATIDVAPFTQIAGEIVPRTSTGARAGRHELAVDNLGNKPELVSISASDPDRLLRFRISPANPTLLPGTATFIALQAKPRKTFVQGPNKTIPFQVTASPSDGEALTLSGTLVQKALLPRWFFKAVAFAAIGCVALVALWLTVLKPTVQSTAEAVAADHTDELAKAIEDATAKSDQASSDAGSAQQDASSAKKDARDAKQSAADAKAGGGANLDPAEATDFRVTTEAAPAGGFVDTQYAVPDKHTVWISDLVLQNPAGDSGTLRIQRGDDVLLEFGLQNFRDLDYHFIQPAMFAPSEPIVVSVDCANDGQRTCSPSVYFGGQSIPDPKGGDPASGGAVSDSTQAGGD
jgi:hypothetical protein